MFQPLRTGKESHSSWDDQVNYTPGRFRAHPTTSTAASRFFSFSRSSSQQPALRQQASPARERLQPNTSTSNNYYDPSLSNATSSNAFGRPRINSPRNEAGTRALRKETSRGLGNGADEADEGSWLLIGLRPSRRRVEGWLDSWWKRWCILVLVPSVMIWAWCAVPFPVSNPYDPNPSIPWNPGWNWTHPSPTVTSSLLVFPSATLSSATTAYTAPNAMNPDNVLLVLAPTRSPVVNSSADMALYPEENDEDSSNRKGRSDDPNDDADLPVDVNFYFFLFFYYGIYVAWALIFITSLFNLYRLNWWPSSLGGAVSYTLFWSLALLTGLVLHEFDALGIRQRRRRREGDGEPGDDENVDWERKTVWVTLAFVSMSLPAFACFLKLRRDRRMTYRHSLTETQKFSFLGSQIQNRIPRSYVRFLWFLLALIIACLSLMAGQAHSSMFLSSLPHSSLDGAVYVWTWVATVQLLNSVTTWIMEEKVRSRALVFVFRYYFYLVYYVFYRTLFARLRSPDQYAFIQLLSSIWIISFYPLSMTRLFHKALQWFLGYEKTLEEHRDVMGQSLWLRNLSENVTMVSFLGYLTILHFGPNREVYPFFGFTEPQDPYNYALTAIASLVIWTTELASSFIARQICWYAYKVDVTNLGLDELRGYPELVPACIWTSIHVLSDILLFLVKLNFR